MSAYCKAYLASSFRAYEQWTEPESAAAADSEEPIFYLHDNYVVTDGIYLDENVVFDRVTPEWERFCRETLQFAVPDDVIAASAGSNSPS